MEIWNEFCSYLIDCKERNVSEERYHEIIESQLSVLGWKRYKGEICHKERIPSGHGFAEPDIIIKKDSEEAQPPANEGGTIAAVVLYAVVHASCRYIHW